MGIYLLFLIIFYFYFLKIFFPYFLKNSFYYSKVILVLTFFSICFSQIFSFFFEHQAGLSVGGAVLGAILVLNYFKINIPFLLNHAFIALALGRIACFIENCCYGTFLQIPIILLESLMLLIFACLPLSNPFTFLKSYFLLRFFLDFYRLDSYHFFHLSSSQWITLFFSFEYTLSKIHKKFISPFKHESHLKLNFKL